MNSVTRAIEKAKPTAPAGVVPVDLRGLMTQDWPAARYVLEPIVPRRETTLLGGHGGIGKSMLALTLAAHVACGRKWGPFPAVQCRAAYVSLEDEAATVRYRLRRIIEVYSLPPEHVIDALTVFDGSGCDAAMATEIMQEGVRRLEPTVGMDRVATAVKGAGLIVVDNASDAYAGNENERRQVRAFIRLLTGIARENDAGMLLLAHIDKSAAKYGANGNSYSGSTAWHNSVRSRLALLSEDGRITLAHEKAQFSQSAEPVPLAFTDHGVLVPQDAHATATATNEHDAADADAVLIAIRAALAANRIVSAAQAGSATTWHSLEPFPELPADLKKPDGKRRVRTAIVRLERDGRIVKGTYKKPNRHEGECYELAQTAPAFAPESALRSPPHTPPQELAQRAGARQSRNGAPIRTGAELAQLAQNEVPNDWLASADPEIRRRVEAFRVNGSNHD